jgi:hypothetical protein
VTSDSTSFEVDPDLLPVTRIRYRIRICTEFYYTGSTLLKCIYKRGELRLRGSASVRLCLTQIIENPCLVYEGDFFRTLDVLAIN